MRVITSQIINKWLERFSYWQKFLEQDTSDYVSGSVAIDRAIDELGEEEVMVSLHLTLKPTYVTNFQERYIRKKVCFSTLDGQKKYDELEEFICTAERSWCMPSLNGLYYTPQSYKDNLAEARERNAKEHTQGRCFARSDYEIDECVGMDSAR